MWCEGKLFLLSQLPMYKTKTQNNYHRRNQMKFNKWTLGLAAIGVVSLASASQAKADGAPEQPTYMESATKGISISGYVDTSVEWAMYPGTERSANSTMSAIPFRGGNKQDGFNLNVVELNFEKPLDEAPAASGFKVSLLAGPDAVNYNIVDPNNVASATDGFAIKQAYISLRAPVGNGIDFKIGVFDTIIGYEVFEAGSNPNFSRSWGYYWEPTEHEGVLASYKINDNISVSLGVANTLSSGITARTERNPGSFDDFWCKTWMASITLTAPQDWGFLGGSAAYIGIVDGFNLGLTDDQLNFYAGAVVNTPVAGLTAGIAYDYVDRGLSTGFDDVVNNLGIYTSYKITEKLSVHGRYEYGWFATDTALDDHCYWGLTGTIQYDIWQNVISRLEIRHEEDNNFVEDCGTGLYLNFIYKF
jgi:hypothetical protein